MVIDPKGFPFSSSAISNILIKVNRAVDFPNRSENELNLPEPVLPMIATFSPLLILKLIPSKTSGRPFLYLALKFLTSILPVFGQFSGALGLKNGFS
jgi:hypothetical protein